MKENIAKMEENNDDTLGVIFDKIQNELHDKGNAKNKEISK